MTTLKKDTLPHSKLDPSDHAGDCGEECWTYLKTVVGIVREPVLVLDSSFRVLIANESFYTLFQVDPQATEGTVVYTLGNGQWNIPMLKKLLEEILPQNIFFKGFEMSHNFPFIGQKTMVINARRIQMTEKDRASLLPPIIFLAMEDVTAVMAVAETFAFHVKELAAKNVVQTKKLEMHVEKLEKEMHAHKKRKKIDE